MKKNGNKTGKSVSAAVLVVAVTMALPFQVFADGGARSGPAYDLETLYGMAIKKSETITISEEQIKQAEEQYNSARASMLPLLSFRAQELFMDTSGENAVNSSVISSPQPTVNFNLRMPIPILSGYREMAALDAAKTLGNQRKLEKKRAEDLIYVDVAQSFLSILSAERNIEIIRNQRKLTEDRIAELRDRERVGRSRESEVVAVESQMATLDASIEVLARTAGSSREFLEYLTGCERGAALKDDGQAPGDPGPVEKYVEASRNRPDILAQQESIAALQATIDAAWAGHLPAFNANANYYLDRTGSMEPVHWDALLMVEVPIWGWGYVSATVRDAESKKRAAELAVANTKRQAERDVIMAWGDLKASASQTPIYERAFKAAERNYNLQNRDYKRNLVSNLDVLQALDRMNAARQQLDLEQFRAKLARARLEVASGQLKRGKGNAQ